jgi:formylglycine-generating enzyme required for sulfatase activity/tRNA A-37 threonylcarbamoyl transferase component Bud32
MINTVCCLNPECSQPENPVNSRFCQSCATELVILRNRYQPVKLLSDQGGFGRTYLAIDLDKLNRECVIKQLAPQVQGTGALKKATELFEQEARQLEELGENPQIPELLAYFEEKGHLYLIQQYIKGKTLDRLVNEGIWNEQQMKGFLINILPVLVLIHSKNIIHRDIKPSNIIKRDVDGNYVLIDFGASKELAATVATRATQIGTYGYAPREQLIEGKVYQASDLYGLGVVCFYLLTKKDPGILYMDQGYQWLDHWESYLPQSLSPEFKGILAKLLQREVTNRFSSAQQVLKALLIPSQITVKLDSDSVRNDSQTKKIQRALFLKYLGWTSVGIVSAGILGLILRNLKPTPEPEPTPDDGMNWQSFNFETLQVDSSGNVIKRQTKSAKYFTIDLGNGVTMDLVEIPGGTFLMGSPESEHGRDPNENFQHPVTVSPFTLGKYPVTQAQWKAVMGNNPSSFQNKSETSEDTSAWENRPVESVSYDNCVTFCNILSQKIGKEVRLPSEAEWEYACRAGTTTPFYFGETITTQLANYNGTLTYAQEATGIYREETTIVGIFPPNNFGLYDMHGNVWEWCADNWHDNYDSAPRDGSVWLDSGENSNSFVLRGGSWYFEPIYCRSADRDHYSRESVYNNMGFRVVIVI